MDIIKLAALPAETPPLAALKLMCARRQTAVVSVNGEALHLVHAADVGRGLTDGKHTLLDIEELTPVSRDLVPLTTVIWPGTTWIVTESTGGTLAYRGAETLTHVNDFSAIEAHFAVISADYVLAELEVGEASIITRHGGLAAALQGDPSRTHCSCNESFHNYDLYVGMTCPKHQCPVN